MSLYHDLCQRSADPRRPFLLGPGESLSLADMARASHQCAGVAPGDVVALVGDFDAAGIRNLLTLVDRKAIVMPLVEANRAQHE